MTGNDAIYEMQRRGVELYLALNNDLILRSAVAGARIPDDVVDLARTHRAAIVAIANEHMQPKGRYVDCKL